MATNSTNDFVMNAQDPTGQTADPSQPEVIVEEVFEAIIDPFASDTNPAISADTPVEVVEEVIVVEPEAAVIETESATATPDSADPSTTEPGASDPTAVGAVILTLPALRIPPPPNQAPAIQLRSAL